MLLFNICPTLYCHSQEHRNKKPLFSCRGCNSMLSKPIVLQKLHLFFPCIVYWWCGSGRRLDGHNYAASQTRETAFPFTWISVFLKPKVRKDWINMFIFFGNRPQSSMLTLSSAAPTVTHSCKYDDQVMYSQHWLSHTIISVCLALVFGLGQRLCLLKVLNQNPCFKQTDQPVFGKNVCRAFGGVTKTFKDVNAIDSKYFELLLNTVQWLFHKEAACNMFCPPTLHIKVCWQTFTSCTADVKKVV